MQFLVLEENERILQIYQKFFDSKGFHVDFVNDEEACLKKIACLADYDYIILEGSSPSENLILEEKIKGINSQQKTLFLSPYMNLENNEISKETQYLVEKPFAMVTLLGKIELERIRPVIKVK